VTEKSKHKKTYHRILGIDPGYERVGLAVLEKDDSGKEVVLFSECFKTKKDFSHGDRLAKIGAEMRRVIDEFKPSAVSIEKLFFNTNQKTAFLVSEARGVILYEASLCNIKIFEFTPLEIKVAVTGYGRADKRQVIKMVNALVPMNKRGMEDDEYDAIATAITCMAVSK